MKKIFMLLASLAAVAGLHAQTTGIAGTVVDAETRQPIPGATVCCYVASAQTDSLGNYLIAGIAPGCYRVRAIKTGYQIAYYPESVEVIHGRVTPGIDFTLIRTGAQYGCISGRVTDSRNGNVIVGAEVRAAGPPGSRGTLQGTCEYRIDSLLPGKYRVSATAAGYEPGCYPESVTVVAGQNTGGICFRLSPIGSQTGGIAGWVYDARTRLPIVGATVCCGAGNARTNERGYYIIDGLEPRRYQVRAMAHGYVTAVYPESVEVAGGRVTENINFHLEPSGQQCGGIAGRVTNSETGELIRGAVVRATSGNLSRSVTQCSTGYRFCELPPGRYWVSATCRGFEDGHYPDSVEVIAGQVTDGINFQLRPTGIQYGGIAGFVTNARTGEPIMGALVVALGPSRGRASTCQRGGYAIRELLPGRYVVEACARGFQPGRIGEVEVVAGQTTTGVNFALAPLSGGTGVITGWVRDSLTNAGINDAYILAWGEAGQGSTRSETSGYAIRELREGAYVVRACKRGYYHRLFPETVYVAAGDTVREINFLLVPVRRQTGGVSGFVFDGFDQTAISGASVIIIGTRGSWEVTSGDCGDYLLEGLEPDDYRIEVRSAGYDPEFYPEAVTVETGVIAGLISPALYPLTSTAEPRATQTQPRLAASPNPFSGKTRLQFAPAWRETELLILDRTGRIVRALTVGQGRSSASWDGCDDSGRRVAEGIYFCRLNTAEAGAWTKVIMTR